MAVLGNPQRQSLADDINRTKDTGWGTCGALKADVRQLVDAVDDWIDTNATAFNLSIPAGIRNKFTAAQKALVFALVALKRYGG